VHTSSVRAMEIRINAFRTHLSDFLDLAVGDILEESAEVGASVQSP